MGDAGVRVVGLAATACCCGFAGGYRSGYAVTSATRRPFPAGGRGRRASPWWEGGRVTTQTPASVPSSAPAKTFLGQPRLLANLFGVEMWERFSFYGMQGILLIYLYYSAVQGGLGIDKVSATSIVGAYGGLVYLSTILGAWLADRLLGSERMLFYSAIVIMCGHLSLSLLPGLLGWVSGWWPSRWAAAGSRPTPRRWSGRCTRRRTRGGTRVSRSSTWASTSVPCSVRCSPGWSSRTGGSTPVSRWPLSAWRSG